MKVAVVGEAMFEFHGQGNTGDGLRYAGDTLNTAIHMARIGLDVAYVTAVGSDNLSDALVAEWAKEGLDTHHVLRHPDRQPGIYAIHVDPAGERSFLYWRDQSAARAMFDLTGMSDICVQAAKADLLYFSHVSLAILPEDGRERLIALAATVRERGGRVAYDSNFRPRLWKSPDAAKFWSDRATAIATIGLPTADDERAMHGSHDSDTAIARRWLALGCEEVAVKSGSVGCVIATPGLEPQLVRCDRLDMVDSSGAGDSFNAGYLAARMAGLHPRTAAMQAHQLAAWVISRRGALPAIDVQAPYQKLSASGTVEI